MNAEIVRPARLQGAHGAAAPAARRWSASAGDVPATAAADTIVELTTFADREPIAVGPRSAEYLCRLAEGWAFRQQILRSGARQITDVFVPGDLIPASLFARRETIACGEARVLILSQACPKGDAASTFRHIRESAREAEIRILRARLVSLGRLDSRARVAHFFAELHARLNMSGRVVDGAFTCPLTQEHVADVLGLTTVHVNRTMRRLRAEGLLVISRPRVRIPDVGRLRDATGFDAGYEDFGEAIDRATL